MSITVNNRPSTSALVSVQGLADRAGVKPETELRKLTRANVDVMPHQGASWVQANDDAVQKLLAKTGLDDAALFTADGAAKAFKAPKGAVAEALTGSDALFMTGTHVPLHLEADVTSAIAAAPTVERSSSSIARTALRAAPFIAGAAGTIALGQVLLDRVGGSMESSEEHEARKIGMTLGMGVASASAGTLVAVGIRNELPRIATGAIGVAAGGVAIGALALTAAINKEAH